ncbi:MAG: TIR domain-containing protein [Deltaproteobacteria bacterium]|nr:TIR domain-containing protein [Deltaproteobacteria bacterium]
MAEPEPSGDPTTPDGVLLRGRVSTEGGEARARSPVTIYVMWHPDYAEGPGLARAVYEWLGDATSDLRRMGLGIPVYFRSEDWESRLALADEGTAAIEPGSPDHEIEVQRHERGRRVRRPIDVDGASHNVFVPLIDDNMVADPSWRRDLVELANAHRDAGAAEAGPTGSACHLVSVQATDHWTRLPPIITRTQPVFLRRWSDPGEETPQQESTRLQVRLCRELTQALVRILRESRNADLVMQVFLSHAKRDGALGPGVAEQLRDVSAGYGQIDVFYDENDLPIARGWEDHMMASAGHGVGFIAVLSDHYATRYWCRREVEMARRPRPLTEGDAASGDDGADRHIWTISPTVAVETMNDTWSRFVGELATVPVLSWSEDRAREVLDRLFRESLLADFQCMYAQQLYRLLAARVVDADVDAGLTVAFVTWMPDLSSSLRLYKRLVDDDPEHREQWLIVYPGHGFLPTEEETLHHSFQERVRFISFERLVDHLAQLSGAAPMPWPELRATVLAPVADTGATTFAGRPRIALSAGDAPDLAALGYDAPSDTNSVHVDAAVLRLVRGMLEAGARIAYGGALRDGPNFTSLVHEAVFGAYANSVQSNVATDPDPATPLENYVIWPRGVGRKAALRASQVGLARHYDVWPPDMDPAADEGPQHLSDDDLQWHTARALSRMRRVVAERCRATVAVAGRTAGASGFMSGIAEEVLNATEVACGLDSPVDLIAGTQLKLSASDIGPQQVRVVLIGAFGGAARVIAGHVLGLTTQAPERLTWEWQKQEAEGVRLTALTSREGAERWIKARYEALRVVLDGLRAIAMLDDSTVLPVLGLTVGQWKTLMSTDSPGRIRRMLEGTVIPALRRA